MVDWVIMVGGWLLAALSGLLSRRLNTDRRVVPFRAADSHRLDWRTAVPYFLGLALTTFGGAGLQQRSFGFWALPLAIVPFFLAFVITVKSHNDEVRRRRLG